MNTYFESEDEDFCIFVKDIEDHDDEVNRAWMDSYRPEGISSKKIVWSNRQLYLLLAEKTIGNPLQRVNSLEEDATRRGAAAWANIVNAGKGRNALTS